MLVNDGYNAFARAALDERRAAGLPPFSCQALLRAEASQPEQPQAFLQQAAAIASEIKADVELLGPVPAPLERRAGRYRAQLLVQSTQRPHLHRFLELWLVRLQELKTGRKIRWSLDVDPADLS